MRTIGTVLVALVAVNLATAAGIDLSKIERQINKEPTYKGKPRYALLAFGKEAATRVWMVADGNTVYLDRNGNGDLTDAGDKLDLTNPIGKGPAAKNPYGEITEPSGAKYAIQSIQNLGDSFKLTLTEQSEALKNQKGPEAEKAREEFEAQVKQFESYYMMTIELPGHVVQYTGMTLGTSKEDAPVYHYGGPLQMWARPQQLTRGAKESEISTFVATPGYSKSATKDNPPLVLINCCTEGSVPKDAHPTLEIEFPNKEAGGKPIVRKFELKERC